MMVSALPLPSSVPRSRKVWYQAPLRSGAGVGDGAAVSALGGAETPGAGESSWTEGEEGTAIEGGPTKS